MDNYSSFHTPCLRKILNSVFAGHKTISYIQSLNSSPPPTKKEEEENAGLVMCSEETSATSLKQVCDGHPRGKEGYTKRYIEENCRSENEQHAAYSTAGVQNERQNLLLPFTTPLCLLGCDCLVDHRLKSWLD